MSQECFHATCVRAYSHVCDKLNAKDADMEKVLLSRDITTKVLVRHKLDTFVSQSLEEGSEDTTCKNGACGMQHYKIASI